jgi:hypothetical protein
MRLEGVTSHRKETIILVTCGCLTPSRKDLSLMVKDDTSQRLVPESCSSGGVPMTIRYEREGLQRGHTRPETPATGKYCLWLRCPLLHSCDYGHEHLSQECFYEEHACLELRSQEKKKI